MIERLKYITYLNSWANSEFTAPILLRGARQVGKTTLARQIGEKFKTFVELNFEEQPSFKKIFSSDLSPEIILPLLESVTNTKIIPSQTLLFLDEIQECPSAITSLRYFYEKMPELHVIASGSLLQFQIEEIGLPVGRIQEVFVYPLTFTDYLEKSFPKYQEIFSKALSTLTPLPEPIHERFLILLKNFLAVGGMPKVISDFISSNSFSEAQASQTRIVVNYRSDMLKYAKRTQLPLLEDLMLAISKNIGKKFVYSHVSRETRSSKIKEGLSLLRRAGICHQVFHTSSNGLPLGAEVNREFFKVIFLDSGLNNNLLGLDLESFLMENPEVFIHRGGLAEQFVGQEIVSSEIFTPSELHYWAREARGSSAEVDYIINLKSKVVPVEVKAGKSGSLKSLHLFLNEKKTSKVGLHLSTHNIYKKDNIIGIPLYMLGFLLEQKLEVVR